MAEDTRDIFLFDAPTLLNRVGDAGFEVAARHFRDKIKAHRPEAAVLRVSPEPGGDESALIELAHALAVPVARRDARDALSLAAALVAHAPEKVSIHVVSDDPWSAALQVDPRVRWHSQEGVRTVADAEAQCQAHDLPLARWPDLIALTTNPWIDVRQAAAWLKTHGSLDTLLALAVPPAGAAGRRFAMYKERLKQGWNALKTPGELDLATLAWTPPRTASDRARIRAAYHKLGLVHWLEPGQSEASVVTEPGPLEALLSRLALQEQIGVSATFVGKRLDAVLLEQASPARTWTVKIAGSPRGEELEVQLAAWLAEPARQGKLVTDDITAMSPWLQAHGVDATITGADAALIERYLDAQDLAGLALEQSGRGLLARIETSRTRLNNFDPRAEKWLQSVEVPLSPILHAMHTGGVRVDVARLARLEREARKAAQADDASASNLLRHFLLPLKQHVTSNRVHPSFDPFSGRNGRISTSRPQLQNLPQSDWGKALRRCLVPDAPGHCLLSLDYKQIEMVILAHLARDKALLSALRQGLDIHQFTASEIFDCALNAVTDEQRRAAKAINFGLVFGLTPYGLARDLDISREKAERYIHAYFSRMPDARRYLEQLREQARTTGSVETLFKRRVHIPDAGHDDGRRRNRAMRQAVNAPMQGTAAEFIKRAMLDSCCWLTRHGVEGRLIMQVHDELIFSVHEQDAERALAGLVLCMQQAAPLHTGIVINARKGPDYGTLTPCAPAAPSADRPALALG